MMRMTIVFLLTVVVLQAQATFEGQARTVGPVNDTDMAAEDFGDFTCDGNEDGCTLNSNSVSSVEISSGTITVNEIGNGITLSANPSSTPEECFWGGKDGSESGGFICEGTAANTNEQLYLFPAQDGADTTHLIAVSDFPQVTGAWDFGGVTSFEIPNGATPTTDAFGELAADNDAWAASRGALQHYDGTAATFVVATLVSDTPINGQVPKWKTGGTVVWEEDDGACKKYTVAATDLTTASATEDEVLFQLPARGKITGVTIKTATAFAGGSLSAATVSVGDSSSDTVYTGTEDIFASVSDTNFLDADLHKSTTFAARDVFGHFIATSDTWDNVGTGSVDIWVCWVTLP